MDAQTPTNRRLSTLIAVGCLLACVGLVWLIVLSVRISSTRVAQADRPALTPGVATDAPPDESLTPLAAAPSVSVQSDFVSRLLLEFDLDTGSTEFSGVALNEELNRLLIADDEDLIFEFDLTDDGRPVLPMRRALSVEVGAGDIEGIAWLSGTEYVLAHEGDGRLTVVAFDDDVRTITDEHLQRTIDTGIREVDGSGLEGVAFVGFVAGPIEFIAVAERPPAIVFIDREGNVANSIVPDLGVPDLSGIWASNAQTLSVLSDEGRAVIDITIDDAGRVATVATLNLDTAEGVFAQPEGIVRSRDRSQLFVVGEAPGPAQFAFGWWRTE